MSDKPTFQPGIPHHRVVYAYEGQLENAVAAERERCARLVPTNWSDPLLTGPDAPKHPLDNRGVEMLLRGIQDRIRNSKPETE